MKQLADNVEDVVKTTSNLNRKETFTKAKDLVDVPRSQQPTQQWRVGDDITKKGYET
ncbi:hypothetical protein MM221_03660 [Salipaludibacillus sp. LMS25]|jgi:hypothetical protein|uniref:hypothetical protein n=1 Tax=Salipaludibacillus sp. LMS25 TaxID=2924031 RepID=UPI0020D06110|nr:hypothetical protein [Salipaludibacillus sp. LMS25]UTR15695.1 hypothetical protein MM221_03660 [Salipaludibacillus sp. LMS25]